MSAPSTSSFSVIVTVTSYRRKIRLLYLYLYLYLYTRVKSWTTSYAISFPGSLFSASLCRWNRDPGCGWSRVHLPIQNSRVGGYSSTFGREEDKMPPCCPTIPADFSTTQILGGHVISRYQGVCSNDQGRQGRETLGLRLPVMDP